MGCWVMQGRGVRQWPEAVASARIPVGTSSACTPAGGGLTLQEGAGRAVPALMSSWVMAAAVGMDPLSSLAAGGLRWLPLAEGFCWGGLKGMVWCALGCCPAGAGRRRLAALSFPWGRLGSRWQLSGAPALAGRLLGSFLSLSPEYTFVLEDEGGPCGYAAGALCAEGFLQQRDSSWLPAIRHKYPQDLGAGAPALGQVRGHLEQRGAGMGGTEGVPSLVFVSCRMPWRKHCSSSTQSHRPCPCLCCGASPPWCSWAQPPVCWMRGPAAAWLSAC